MRHKAGAVVEFMGSGVLSAAGWTLISNKYGGTTELVLVQAGPRRASCWLRAIPSEDSDRFRRSSFR